MEYFEPGTRVRCLDSGGCTYLMTGEVYTVRSCKVALRPNTYIVKLEEITRSHVYHTDRFVRVESSKPKGGKPKGGLTNFLEKTS